MNIVFQAMTFASKVHATQLRTYTGDPYTIHLAEVAAITGAALWNDPIAEVAVACAWLHDCVEDQGVTEQTLRDMFGSQIAEGVMLLSDLEEGNRATRKAASRARLAAAPSWVQSIKTADMISNTASIVKHDPKFAVTYLEEKRLLLNVLTLADTRLVAIARTQI